MRFKELRIQKGKNQTETANYLGIRQESYSAYELNKAQPSIENLIKLADYYNVSLDYLCERPFNNQIGYIPEDKKEVVKLILQLNEVNTIKILGYVSGLLATQTN